MRSGFFIYTSFFCGIMSGNGNKCLHLYKFILDCGKFTCAHQNNRRIGMWKMLEKEYVDSWYTCFAAGAVVVSIPISILFLMTQKFYVEGMSGAVKG